MPIGRVFFFRILFFFLMFISVARHRQGGREEGRSEQANTVELVNSDGHVLFAANMCTKDVTTTVAFRTEFCHLLALHGGSCIFILNVMDC